MPLSIVHKKDIALDGSNAAMITGYGAYGISRSPFYIPAMQAWYDRARHDRLRACARRRRVGEAWHQAGYQATKPNTWKDFIACAQYLVDASTQPAQAVRMCAERRRHPDRPRDRGAARPVRRRVIRVPAADMLRFQTTANGPDQHSRVRRRATRPTASRRCTR